MIVKHRTLESIQISSMEKPQLEGFNGYFNGLVNNMENGLSWLSGIEIQLLKWTE